MAGLVLDNIEIHVIYYKLSSMVELNLTLVMSDK
jgi:hypothetical protein